MATLDHPPNEFSSEHDPSVEHLRHIIASINEKGSKRTSLVQETSVNGQHESSSFYFPRISVVEDEKPGSRLSVQSISREKNSTHSRSNSPMSRNSPLPTATYESRYRKISVVDVDEHDERDEVFRRQSISPSPASARHSVDRFPPPPTPKQFESFEVNEQETNRGRSMSPSSNHSSSNANTNEHTTTDEVSSLRKNQTKQKTIGFLPLTSMYYYVI